MSCGNSASTSRLKSIGDGPWGSAPVGVIGPGPLLGCALRAGLGGVCEVESEPLLGPDLLLGPFSLATGEASFAANLLAAAPKSSKFVPCPTITEKGFEMREKGGEFFEGTWCWRELPEAIAAPVANGVETSGWQVGGGIQWSLPSLGSPSLRALAACATLLGAHPSPPSLGATLSVAVAPAVFLSVLSQFPRGRELGAMGAS